MYIKVNNGVVEKYPYSINELRKDNPQTSFPKNPTVGLLAEWGVFPVQSTSTPTFDYTKNVKEGAPVFDGTSWIQIWEISDALPEEINQRINETADGIRGTRDQLLAATDWVVAKSYEQQVPVPQEWVAYRQALRDIPQQEGFPFEVAWPVAPQ